MAFTKKIAGWVAGRIKGEQARKDTMRWMEKTGLGQILDIAGDIALTQGAIKGVSGLKGLMTGGQAAPLKALPTGQASTTVAPRTAAAITPPSAPVAPPSVATQAPMRAMVAPGAGSTAMAPRAAAMVTPPAAPAAMPSAAMAARAPMAPPAAPAPLPTGGMTPAMSGTAQRMGGLQNVANANIAGGPGGFRGIAQFGRENASWLGPAATATSNVIGKRMEMSLEEEQMKREQDAKNRLAMLLMPMFQSQLGQYGQLYGQPRQG